MSHFKIDNLTQDHLVGPVINLLKGTCKICVELEYKIYECYKAVTNQMDWNNPEGKESPFDLCKPLPLIMDRGHQVVPVDYFINNDLEYLREEGLESSSFFLSFWDFILMCISVVLIEHHVRIVRDLLCVEWIVRFPSIYHLRISWIPIGIVVAVLKPVLFGAYEDEIVVGIIARVARMGIDYHELSKIDLYSGCHQIRVYEDEIPNTSFRVRYGRYEFTAMHFWVDQCTSDFHGRNESDEFRVVEEREVSCEAQQGRSGVKRKLFGSCRNNMGDIRTLIMKEAHATKYSVLLGVRKITMECIPELPRTSSRYDAIWVIVDRLTKLAYFLAIRKEYKMEWLARLYVDEAVARHEVHVLSIPDRDGMYIEVLARDVEVAEIGESKMIGLEMEQETTKVVVIKERLKEAKDRVVRFGKKGKLAPRTFISIINKFLTGKSSGVDRARQPMVQILWGIVNKANVDYADLIWEEFIYNIKSRKTKTKKAAQLPYPRFTKLIINHLLSQHNNLAKRVNTVMHHIKDDEVLPKLKFVAKGEPIGKPRYGKAIPDVILSDDIKASADYMKLKSVEQIAPDAQLLLDLKKGSRASIEAYILKQMPKGPGEGSSTVLDTPDHRDSFDTSSWGNPSVIISSHEDVLRYLNENPENMFMDIMSGPVHTKTQTTSLVPIQDGNPKVTSYISGASEVPLDHIEVIEELVKANILNEVKNQLLKFVPIAVSDFVQPHLERTALDVMKKNLINLFKSLFTQLDNKYMQIDELQARYELAQPSRKKRSYHDQDPPKNREGKNQKRRRKGVEGDDKLLIIIAKDLKDVEKTALIKVLKSHKQALAWQLFDIKGIDPEFRTHKILMEDDFKPAVQYQRRVNPKIHEEDPDHGKIASYEMAELIHILLEVHQFAYILIKHHKEHAICHELRVPKAWKSKKKFALSFSKIKAARYEQENIKEIIPHLWSLSIQKYERDAELGIHHWRSNRQWFYKRSVGRPSTHDVYSKIMIIRILNKVYRKLDMMLKDNVFGFGNEGLEDHAWKIKDKERTESMMNKIEKTSKERQMINVGTLCLRKKKGNQI
nr:reverse transcriptase domain-containing protein [Tanacetum cinerariifolium]